MVWIGWYTRRLSRLAVAAALTTWCAYGGAGHAEVAPARQAILAAGINVGRWLSLPAPQKPAYYAAYLNGVPEQLRSAGFRYVRVSLSIRALSKASGTLDQSILDIVIPRFVEMQRVGLGVMVVPQPQDLELETSGKDRGILLRFWEQLSVQLAGLNQDLLFPEVLNEPNFRDARAWDKLQAQIVGEIRSHLPRATIIVTGNHWSNIDGLKQTQVLADSNVAYSFHFYEPSILALEYPKVPVADRPALAKLVFPVRDIESCTTAELLAPDRPIRDQIDHYCRSGWSVERVRSRIAEAAQWGRQNKVVVVNTEFGIAADRTMPTRLAYLQAVSAACRDEGVGWGLWSYDGFYGFEIHPEKTGPMPLDRRILDALKW